MTEEAKNIGGTNGNITQGMMVPKGKVIDTSSGTKSNK
eukprot:CAMPEP_0167770482 /NCGR_PEP_ID=MMETSP0110_2-20121227/17955_1 /TAXON_ID=629695 /ORGANISM="Gymnochlora sp., Strain CCMP2014" /LENGTH=37 /DNA_ID= /DNA_START= /DNA_END= /DNA_ORIENTATION=